MNRTWNMIPDFKLSRPNLGAGMRTIPGVIRPAALPVICGPPYSMIARPRNAMSENGSVNRCIPPVVVRTFWLHLQPEATEQLLPRAVALHQACEISGAIQDYKTGRP